MIDWYINAEKLYLSLNYKYLLAFPYHLIAHEYDLVEKSELERHIPIVHDVTVVTFQQKSYSWAGNASNWMSNLLTSFLKINIFISMMSHWLRNQNLMAKLSHVLSPEVKCPPPPHSTFDSRIHAVFLAEFTWSRLLRSCFHVHALPDVLCWTLSYRMHDMQWPQILSLSSWESGGGGWGTKPLPSRSRAAVCWVSRGQNPLELRKSGILRYKIQLKNSTVWFSFLVQNEFKRKDHPFDVPNKANYTFAQI